MSKFTHSGWRSVWMLAVLLLAIGLSACAGSGTASEESEQQMDPDALVGQLNRRGIEVSRRPLTTDPLFNAPAMELRTRVGDVIQVYEFTDVARAKAEATYLTPNAASPPYFYRRGNLIVVHFGRDANVENALNEVLGSQII